MLSGGGGPKVIFDVGLFSKMPAEFVSIWFAAATARRMVAGPLRSAWLSLTAALTLYFIGDGIGLVTWLLGSDPFPGPSDVFYCAFYLPLAAAALWLIRAAAVRVPWVQLSLDATIFVVGFGAFFWFLVVQPAAMHAQLGILKEALSEAYLSLDSLCLLVFGVLVFGVLLLTGSSAAGGWRIPLLLLASFATMFIGDIFWSLGKVRGYYLPGGVQDVIYLVCYLPLAAAGREQMRAVGAAARATSRTSGALARSLPYAAMAAAFLVLIYLSRGGLGGQATLMIGIVFVLTLLLMFRQAVVLRMTEERYASLVANASDVIMIVGPDGVVRFASPAATRTLGLKPEQITSKRLAELWDGEDGERLRSFLAEIAATPCGAVGPVELRIERASRVIEAVGSNLSNDPAVRGFALNFRDISERKVLEEKLRELAFHDPLTQACRDICAWRRSIAGGAGLRLAVNISAHHLQQGDLIRDIREALETSGLEAGNLVIELTESTLMYNSKVNLERFQHLKALGVKVAIDDFGTGYSSLSYLHRFPIDILKIDRSFVNGLTSSDDGPELARAEIGRASCRERV